MRKIAVIVGHNQISQGAQSITPIDRSELDFNSELAQAMEQRASDFNVEIKVFHREHQGSYRREILKVYGEVNEWDPEYSTELHFNSSVFTVSGSEVLSSGSRKSLRFAQLTQDEMVNLFDRKRSNRGDRGVKTRRQGRGALSLLSGNAPAIIVEPFFGSNRADCRRMNEIGIENLAIAYLTAMSKL